MYYTVCYNFGLFNSEHCKRPGIKMLCLFIESLDTIQMQQQTNVNQSEPVSICLIINIKLDFSYL